MSYWFNLLIEKERRRQEVARAAERRSQKRLLSQARSHGGLVDDGGRQTADGDRTLWLQRGGNVLRSRYERFLVLLGALLVLWGQRLQKRYERFPESSTLRAKQLDFVNERPGRTP